MNGLKTKYDYVIVGSGLFGSICAYELNKRGYKICVIEKRSHIGGNCYTTNKDGINIHEYGPHIFHTSNEYIWRWINQFVKFNNFVLQPVANYKGKIYSLPFNMITFSQLWNVTHPNEAKEIIDSQKSKFVNPSNLEEQALNLVGRDIYETLIKGYTKKQWRKHPHELPKEIINRLPIRFTYNGNYFNDKYQGIPIGGYTQIFEKLLTNIEVLLNTDYLVDSDKWKSLTKNIIYTGQIDAFYDYKFGELEYKTTRFEHIKMQTDNYQGTAMMNYTSEDVIYTRCVEHKHFENSTSDVSWVTYEYPEEYKAGVTEPYYPVNDSVNTIIYKKYKDLADAETNIFFGGRLAEYKYYDMHQVIESALTFVKTLNK